MAFTVSVVEKIVWGNLRVHILDVTHDGAAETVATGLDNVRGVALGSISMATASLSFKPSAGNVAITSGATGDHYYLTVFGR